MWIILIKYEDVDMDRNLWSPDAGGSGVKPEGQVCNKEVVDWP